MAGSPTVCMVISTCSIFFRQVMQLATAQLPSAALYPGVIGVHGAPVGVSSCGTVVSLFTQQEVVQLDCWLCGVQLCSVVFRMWQLSATCSHAVLTPGYRRMMTASVLLVQTQKMGLHLGDRFVGHVDQVCLVGLSELFSVRSHTCDDSPRAGVVFCPVFQTRVGPRDAWPRLHWQHVQSVR